MYNFKWEQILNLLESPRGDLNPPVCLFSSAHLCLGFGQLLVNLASPHYKENLVKSDAAAAAPQISGQFKMSQNSFVCHWAEFLHLQNDLSNKLANRSSNLASGLWPNTLNNSLRKFEKCHGVRIHSTFLLSLSHLELTSRRTRSKNINLPVHSAPSYFFSIVHLSFQIPYF